VGIDNDIHEFFSAAGGWSTFDVTANAMFNTPYVPPVSTIAAHVNTLAGSEEIFFLDSNSDVHEIFAWSSTPLKWNNIASPINSVALPVYPETGPAPAAYPSSPLVTDVNPLGSVDEVYYIDKNYHLNVLRSPLSLPWSWAQVAAYAVP
jgi:hypothetical protein